MNNFNGSSLRAFEKSPLGARMACRPCNDKIIWPGFTGWGGGDLGVTGRAVSLVSDMTATLTPDGYLSYACTGQANDTWVTWLGTPYSSLVYESFITEAPPLGASGPEPGFSVNNVSRLGLVAPGGNQIWICALGKGEWRFKADLVLNLPSGCTLPSDVALSLRIIDFVPGLFAGHYRKTLWEGTTGIGSISTGWVTYHRASTCYRIILFRMVRTGFFPYSYWNIWSSLGSGYEGYQSVPLYHGVPTGTSTAFTIHMEAERVYQ